MYLCLHTAATLLLIANKWKYATLAYSFDRSASSRTVGSGGIQDDFWVSLPIMKFLFQTSRVSI